MGNNIQKMVRLIVIFSVNTACNSSSSTGVLLEDVDFSNGKYALYIKHKELGEFMVQDEKALKQNRDKLNIKGSLINYLPGEGDRSFGVMLFKDNKLVKQKTGGVFKRFETGSLADYAVAVKQKRINGVKKRILGKRDSISKHHNIFITQQSTFVPDNRAFRFRIYFPSIAVPVTREKDDSGYERIMTVNGIAQDKWTMEGETHFEKRWSKKIENCIRNKADTITDFEVSISKGSVSYDYLLDKTGSNLTMANNKMAYIEDYMYYNFTAYVKADKVNAERLIHLEYSDCISEEERNRPQLIANMEALIKQSSEPTLNIDKGEVWLESYKDNVHTYKTVYEQEYTLTWLETENKM